MVRALAVAAHITQPTGQLVHLGFEVGLDEFRDLGSAQLVELADNITVGPRRRSVRD